MANLMKDYYKKMLKQTNNLEHKKYYLFMLNYFNNKQVSIISDFTFNKKTDYIYSEKLNKKFESMSSASKYVNKGRSYVRRCLIGELENKYLFKKLKRSF